MKHKMLALALFASTATLVAFYPAQKSVGAITQPKVIVNPVPAMSHERPKIEVVFVIDTTGSMSGLIEAAKEKIWSIANTMASSNDAPEIKIGLVAFRDRGDAYITQMTDLSSDLDSMYATLLDFQASGGGDGPESVNKALYDAVNGISWSQDSGTYKTIFLIGDAPPHMDYQDEVQYPATLQVAQQKGIIINTIQCGDNEWTMNPWQKIASLGAGDYFQLDQAGSAIAINTPFDQSIAELSSRLDGTRLYYGNKQVKADKRRKEKATEKLNREATVASLARRASFNLSKSGEANLMGENELIEDIASGLVELKDIVSADLPSTISALAPKEQVALIEEKAEERQALKKQIIALTEKRKVYLKDEVEKRGSSKESLDHKIYSAVRKQAGEKGVRYESDDVAY
jgi:Mg-chelatase subunit ChlD